MATDTQPESGPDTIDRMVSGDNVTLDKWFDRNPREMTREDVVMLVQTMRRQRATRIAKREERKSS